MSYPSNVHSLADDPTKNVVVFINDYSEPHGLALPKLAARLGRQLHAVMLIDKTLKESGQNLAAPAGTFEELVCDFSSDAELRAAVRQFEDRLLLVCCGAESSQIDFKRALPHMPYVLGPSESSLEWATHKGKMREVIGAYNDKLVPKVQHVTGATENEIMKALENLAFPMIIKPTGLSDSTLVTKVHDEKELRSVLRKTFAVLRATYKRNRGNGVPSVLIEEFMEGDLYSIDGYVDQSGQIWLLPLLRSKSAYDMGLEGFYIYQTETHHELADEQDAAGKQAAKEAIHAVGLRSSVAHVELYHTADGWKIIELAARAGALRQAVYEVSYGVDHAFNTLLVKIGLPPEMGTGFRTHSMVFKVYPDAAGTLYAVDGVDEARFHPSTYTLSQFAHPGDQVLPITAGGSVAVQGLLVNNDVDQLRKDVDQLRSAIKLHIDHQPDVQAEDAPAKTQTHSAVS